MRIKVLAAVTPVGFTAIGERMETLKAGWVGEVPDEVGEHLVSIGCAKAEKPAPAPKAKPKKEAATE
jgi:hypothetical protein